MKMLIHGSMKPNGGKSVPLTWSYTKEDGLFGQMDLDPPPFNEAVFGEPPLLPRKSSSPPQADTFLRFSRLPAIEG